jgi:hypothetical protein
MYTDQEATRLLTWEGGEQCKCIPEHRVLVLTYAGKLTLKNAQGGRKVRKNAAISMQMMYWPDVLNYPEWQRDHKILHGPYGLMTTFSSFKFSVARKGHA